MVRGAGGEGGGALPEALHFFISFIVINDRNTDWSGNAFKPEIAAAPGAATAPAGKYVYKFRNSYVICTEKHMTGGPDQFRH